MQVMSPETALDCKVCNLSKVTQSLTVRTKRNAAAQIYFVDAKMD